MKETLNMRWKISWKNYSHLRFSSYFDVFMVLCTIVVKKKVYHSLSDKSGRRKTTEKKSMLHKDMIHGVV